MTESLHDRIVGAVGDHYALEREIGRGGMSVVYRARDVRLNRPVAIKVLPPELAYDPAVRLRFTREAQTSAQLAHAHIVPIYDVGEREGIAYLIMAFVTGGSLAALLAHEPRQSIDEVRRFVCEIAEGLDYAHTRGVIHRDIKPDNILIDGETGHAMVTDFGIARAIEAGTRLTVTGIAVGTPAYMSPEQAVGEREIDGRSDIYSLGVLAYQMLTGRLPFAASNSMAILVKHLTERPRPITELRPDAPRALCQAIERALMKTPEDRWPTAASLRDALRSDQAVVGSWRAERREVVRYQSPNPDTPGRQRALRESGRGDARADARLVSPRRGMPVAAARPALPVPQPPLPGVSLSAPDAPKEIVLEPEHLASLTPEQRADLRLWHGRVNLLDRITAMRGYTLLTVGAIGLGIAGFVGGVSDIPPLVLSPLVPLYMSVKLWRRGKSLRASGLRLRRVLFMPRAKWVIPRPQPKPVEAQLEKLAPREILDGPLGPPIRRAVVERAAILEIVATLSKNERALLPDVEPAVNGLVERVAHLAQMVSRLEQSIDPRVIDELDARIAEVERESGTVEGASPESERRLALYRRRRGTLAELVERRAALVRQLDSAGLALGNIRLDLIKFRASGVQSALSDVTTATQEARALSAEIGAVLEVGEELRGV
ncbi:MAG TPA: serine/threonine-protein kinase [Gemmatimonadaceae bacterium]|nr:serine/threonine-protein kinase [Gemmatimonadaceae bacterium]